jgi:hypothetical protein
MSSCTLDPAPSRPDARRSASVLPATRTRRFWWPALALVAGGALAGCTSVKTRAYFAAADSDSGEPALTFYRVTITGRSTNSKSAIASGFYNADALRAFTGEAPKADGTGGTKTVPTALGVYRLQLNNGNWELQPPETLFTLVYGPDSKAISGVIGNYMKSDLLGQQLGDLLAKASSGEAITAAADITAQKNQLKTTRDTLGQRVTDVGQTLDATKLAAASPEEVLQKLVDAAQVVANALGTTDTFAGATTQDAITQATNFWKSAKVATP